MNPINPFDKPLGSPSIERLASFASGLDHGRTEDTFWNWQFEFEFELRIYLFGDAFSIWNVRYIASIWNWIYVKSICHGNNTLTFIAYRNTNSRTENMLLRTSFFWSHLFFIEYNLDTHSALTPRPRARPNTRKEEIKKLHILQYARNAHPTHTCVP